MKTRPLFAAPFSPVLRSIPLGPCEDLDHQVTIR